MAEIKCMPLKRVTDGPLFGQPPGTLSSLVNMDLDPDGYAEARGGMDKLKPSGGTATDAISAGGFSDALQHSTSYGWIRTYEDLAGAGSQYSKNFQFHDGAFYPFVGNDVNDAIYFGADAPFSRVSASMAFAGIAAPTLVYEYYNGSTWSALTTSETIDFTVLFTRQYASWTLPTDWATTTRGDSGTGNVLKYWMRIRQSAGAWGTIPRVQFAEGSWVGMRELYVATQNPTNGVANGTLKRYGQSGTTAEWFNVNTALFSGNASPARMAAYRGRVVLVNGKDTKRWDGYNFSDLGIPAFSNTVNLVAAAAGVLGAGVWRYYVAWGSGPTQLTSAYADRQDVAALYGIGRATYIGEVTTVAAQRVRIEMTAGAPVGASSVYIFRTQDLTTVTEGRETFPAFLIQSLRRVDPAAGGVFEGNFGTVGQYYYDDATSFVFPNTEAVTHDNTPPSRCKFSTVYQNRLFLADNDTIFWSDAFYPDSFSTKSTTGYIRLSRAEGGRNTGIVEFADQIVAFTEDQTWGITNVDLDVPQLYPIHPGVGCIAPDSIAVGDGYLVWAARDGFYAWDGSRGGPKKISADMDTTFGKMSFETHGGSRGVIHDLKYDFRQSSPGYTSEGFSWRYRLDSGSWSKITHASLNSTMYPLATIHAPLGNSDEGYQHPLWGKCRYSGGSDFALYLGELTTQDNGNNYTCTAYMHFPVPTDKVYKCKRVKGYYQAADGWGTPAFAMITASHIGSAPGTLNTGTADTGTDYSIIGGTFASVARGTSDIVISFSVASAASGTVNGQRFFGALLEGEFAGFRRGAV